MIAPRRHQTWLDDFEPDHLSVFVPGVMGAGVLVSIGILISDALRRLGGERGHERQASVVADNVVQEFALSVHAQTQTTLGLRSRLTYVIGAVALIGIGAYGLIGSFWNFINPVDSGWVEDVAWVWALSTVAALALLGLGALTGLLAIRYPAVPWYAYWLLVRTPLGTGIQLGQNRRPPALRLD